MNQLNDNEFGEKTSLESKVNDIIQKLKQVTMDHNILNPEPFLKLIEELHEQIADVVSVKLYRRLKMSWKNLLSLESVLVQRELEDSGFKLSYNLSIKGCASRADFNGFFKA
jgi:hypothetical protein